MDIKYIKYSNWQNFLLHQIGEYNIFSLFKDGELDYNYSVLSAANLKDTVLGKYRSRVPAKSFFFPSVEKILPQTQTDTKKPSIIVGLKGCELAHLRLIDAMFLGGEFSDSNYGRARNNSIIISTDCTSAKSTCFCSIIEGKPYPTYGFDINLRPIKSGLVVEISTEKGMQLIKNNGSLFQDIGQSHMEESQKNRADTDRLVLNINEKYKFAKALDEAVKPPKTDLWKDIAKECVECGGCRFVCSTCYCFLLGEQKNFEKQRIWDTCQFKGYSRVAGGGNPRPAKLSRYRNFYSCKINYRRQNFGFYACTGCGRCVEVCPAKIDIREALTRLSEPK